MTDMLLIFASILTVLNILVAGFVSAVAATIVYSWWRKLQATKDQLPSMLQSAINELAAKYIEPYREALDEKGRAQTVPTQPAANIPIDEEFNEWMQLP